MNLAAEPWLTVDPAWLYWHPWSVLLLIASGIVLNVAVYFYLRKASR